MVNTIFGSCGVSTEPDQVQTVTTGGNRVNDIISTEVIHPLATLVVPGAVCLLPAALAVANSRSSVLASALATTGGSATVFVVASVAVGLVLENLGSRIEICLDRRHNKRCKNHKERWLNYLKLERSESERVSHRYVDSLQMRLKFELSMVPALVVATLGWAMVCHVYKRYSWCEFSLVTASTVLIAAYLYFEACSTVALLCETRASMI